MGACGDDRVLPAVHASVQHAVIHLADVVSHSGILQTAVQVDFKKLGQALMGSESSRKRLRLATHAEALAATGFGPGTIPPFGEHDSIVKRVLCMMQHQHVLDDMPGTPIPLLCPPRVQNLLGHIPSYHRVSG